MTIASVSSSKRLCAVARWPTAVVGRGREKRRRKKGGELWR